MFGANMYWHAAEVSIGTGVFIVAVLYIEDHTQIRDRFLVTWNIAKVLVFLVLTLLYNIYRRPQLS